MMEHEDDGMGDVRTTASAAYDGVGALRKLANSAKTDIGNLKEEVKRLDRVKQDK